MVVRMVGEYDVMLGDGTPLGRCGCELVLHDDGRARGSLVVQPSEPGHGPFELLLVGGQEFVLRLPDRPLATVAATDDPPTSTMVMTCTVVYASRTDSGAVVFFHSMDDTRLTHGS